MDREIVYPGGVPLDTDLLNAGRNTKKGLGRLAFLLFGEVSAAQGFTLALSSTDLTASAGEGTIIATGPIDQEAIGGLGGGLPADADTILNQFDSWSSQTVTLTAGATNVIWAVCSEVDGDDAALPFYNSENPSQTLAGSANSGADLPTQRQARVSIVCATTAPATPVGGAVVALYSVTVPSSATTLTGLTATPQNAFYPTVPELMRGRLLSTIKITSSQNYTPSRWAKTLVVEMVGGGGSGAGAPAVNTGSNYVSCGSPGAAGAYARFIVDLTTLPISSIPLTIGSAGVGAIGGMGSGGGSTSFGTYVTCGGGGQGQTISAAPGISSWGGAASGGVVSASGASAITMIESYKGSDGWAPVILCGLSGASATTGVPFPIPGSPSRFGAGGYPGNVVNSNAVIESAASRGSYGAGGGGSGSTGTGTTTGANGSPGVMIIQEYS